MENTKEVVNEIKEQIVLIESEIDKSTAAAKGRCRSAANKIKKLSAESKKRISSPTLKKPTPPISKLEERRKEQGKQGKTGRNIIIAIIVIGVIVVFAITPSKKEEACTCVSLWDNYQNKGGMFSTPSCDVQIEIDRCAKRFDGMNNARRICNE